MAQWEDWLSQTWIANPPMSQMVHREERTQLKRRLPNCAWLVGQTYLFWRKLHAFLYLLACLASAVRRFWHAFLYLHTWPVWPVLPGDSGVSASLMILWFSFAGNDKYWNLKHFKTSPDRRHFQTSPDRRNFRTSHVWPRHLVDVKLYLFPNVAGQVMIPNIAGQATFPYVPCLAHSRA